MERYVIFSRKYVHLVMRGYGTKSHLEMSKFSYCIAKLSKTDKPRREADRSERISENRGNQTILGSRVGFPLYLHVLDQLSSM